MTNQKKSIDEKVNNWLTDPKTFFFLGLVVIVIIVGATLFSGNSDKRYLDKQGWNLEINEGTEKLKVNVYFDGDKAYGFVPQQTKLSKKHASKVEYDKKRHQVSVYGSKSQMTFLIGKKKNDQVEGSVTFGNSSEQYSYVMTKNDTIHLK
ncbi:hypothetical protein [Ligilactobacillus acidipiscis]|uniref:hypothetical protein n=1 Tax=Ligilactobacillus acidipiscis TaxID=89059 RepID=UPI0023F85CA8|nr:hypothetical protein [Ligilactobacillus acidipiscis]WEV56373.1 hypothetical protein OZX66_09080 [Ligilactobacillus acidipiscis]